MDQIERREVKETSILKAPQDRHLKDELTGLPNRAWLKLALPILEDQLPGNFAVLFLDLDGFKKTNDTLGHDAGDTKLKEAAHLLNDVTRDSDMLLVRPHGDEFILLLPHVNDDEKLEIAKNRIQETMDEAGVPISVGGSIHTPGIPSDVLLKSADNNLLENKRERKLNQYDTDQLATVKEIGRLAAESGINHRDIPSILDALETTP